jgi:hypothetical protein
MHRPLPGADHRARVGVECLQESPGAAKVRVGSRSSYHRLRPPRPLLGWLGRRPAALPFAVDDLTDVDRAQADLGKLSDEELETLYELARKVEPE